MVLSGLPLSLTFGKKRQLYRPNQPEQSGDQENASGAGVASCTEWLGTTSGSSVTACAVASMALAPAIARHGSEHFVKCVSRPAGSRHHESRVDRVDLKSRQQPQPRFLHLDVPYGSFDSR